MGWLCSPKPRQPYILLCILAFPQLALNVEIGCKDCVQEPSDKL